MLLTKVVEVDDARVEALTPEAFRLVLEARGWVKRGVWWLRGSSIDTDGEYVASQIDTREGPRPLNRRIYLRTLAADHHRGSTYDAFVEIERVQALLEAVEAAERGGWDFGDIVSVAGSTWDAAAPAGHHYVIRLDAWGNVSGGHDGMPAAWRARLWTGDGFSEARAASEARAQLPRLVRIICGVEP